MSGNGNGTTLSLEGLAAEVAHLKELVANTPGLHRKDLQRRWGIAEATLDRWLKLKTFPRPVRFGGPVWRLADIEAAERAGQVPLRSRPDPDGEGRPVIGANPA